MNIFEEYYNVKEETIVTIGKFDGLHEGHKKLIDMTVNEAKKRDCKSLVYTFNQNPREVLKQEIIGNLISKEEKIKLLALMGVDYIVFENFTYEFSKLSPEVFAKEIIKDKLKAKKVIVGFNYKFGKNAEGDVNLLKKYGEEYGFEVEILPPVEKNGIVISSSLIREGVL